MRTDLKISIKICQTDKRYGNVKQSWTLNLRFALYKLFEEVVTFMKEIFEIFIINILYYCHFTPKSVSLLSTPRGFDRHTPKNCYSLPLVRWGFLWQLLK